MDAHIVSYRIYYENTDAGGVTYHADYLAFAERARTEFLRTAGHDHATLRYRHNLIFVVRHLAIDYLTPARLDDQIDIHSTIITFKNARFTMQQKIMCDGVLLADLTVVIVAVSANEFKATRIPDSIKEDLHKISSGDLVSANMAQLN